MPFFSMNMQNVVYDFHLSHLAFYQNGETYLSEHFTSNEAIHWCLKNLNQGASVVLIGPSNETKGMYQYLSKYSLNICCYDNKLLEPNGNINQQTLINDILNSLNEIKTLLKKEPKSANYALINTALPQRETKDIKDLKSFLTESLEALNKKQSEIQYLVSEIYNNRESGASNDGNYEIIEDLRKELAAYKNDFYQKSMLNFGVNTAIEILERLYTEKNLLRQKENAADELARLELIISYCESKMKKLNLKVSHSLGGEEFDGSRMVTYDDKVSTENENMKGRVAYSISPAVYWTLPRVNAPGRDELLIKEETVALYE